MTTEGGEDLQNPETVGDSHAVSWYDIKSGGGELLNDLERTLGRRDPSFQVMPDHRWVYDLGHTGRGYDDFPPNFEFKTYTNL